MATIHKLSARAVQAARPRLRANAKHDKDFVEHSISDGGGLYLRIRSDGVKSWVYLYSHRDTKQQVRLTIGLYPHISLAAARDRSSDFRDLTARGVDPREHLASMTAERLAKEIRSRTFGDVAEECFASLKVDRKWSEEYQSNQRSRYEVWILPKLGHLTFCEINEPLVSGVIRKVWDEGKGETANRAKRIINEVYSFAAGKGIITSAENFMRGNTGIGNVGMVLKKSLPAVVDPLKLGILLRDIRSYEGKGVIVKAALCLLPLLGQRPGQVIAAKWEEFDLDKAMWHVPRLNMKLNAKARSTLPPIFDVPLPTQAVKILRDLKGLTGHAEFVFPSVLTRKGKHISENTINAALRALGYCTRTEVTGHGWRTTMLTLTQEVLGIPFSVADRHLGHLPKCLDAASNLGSTYDRAMLLGQRIKMVQRYADFLDHLAQHAGSGAPERLPDHHFYPDKNGDLAAAA